MWTVSAIIEATGEGAHAAQAAIERALCPDEDHPGYCPCPWTTLIFSSTTSTRARWEADLAKDRQRALEAVSRALEHRVQARHICRSRASEPPRSCAF